MGIRVGPAGTAEPGRAILAEAVLIRIESRMLAREDQTRLKAARGQCVSDGCKLDRFGPGADDEPNICGTQPSP